MSLKAMRCSSWWISVAGIAPAAIRQNRQSATSPPEHNRAGNTLQVVEHATHLPPFTRRGGADLVLLPVTEFNNEGAAGGKQVRGGREQPLDDAHALRSAEQRHRWFVA